jgi:hypothetical protein
LSVWTKSVTAARTFSTFPKGAAVDDLFFQGPVVEALGHAVGLGFFHEGEALG